MPDPTDSNGFVSDESIYRTPLAREIKKVRRSRELILHRVARGIMVVAGVCIATTATVGATLTAYQNSGWTGVGCLYSVGLVFVVVMGSFFYVLDHGGWKGPKA